MLVRKFFIHLIFIYPCIAWTQNLVPNYNFTTYDSCPIDNGQIEFARPWYSPNGETVDFVHECNPGRLTGVPENFWGAELPVSGSGYAGIRTYLDPELARKNNYREFLAIKLKEPLVKGEVYFLSFQVSPGENNRFLTDDVGMFISDKLLNIAPLLSYKPLIENPQGRIIQNFTGWTEISGSYLAKGGEEHLVIGNFKDDNEVSLYLHANSEDLLESSYLYIDGVVVEDCKNRVPEKLILNETNAFCTGEEFTINTILNDSLDFIWDDGFNEANYSVSDTGWYKVEATINGCFKADSIYITEEGPNIELGSDTLICQGEQLELFGDNTAQNVWNTGSFEKNIIVDKPGTYILEAQKNGCIIKDTIEVDFQPFPTSIGSDTVICKDFSAIIGEKVPNSNFQWNTGQTAPYIEVTETGLYLLTITTPCIETTLQYYIAAIECGCGFFAPNAFSPNNDGVNEQFEILVDNAVEPLQLTIINRWGELVYQGINTAIWETEERANLPESGTYFWEFSYRCFEEGQPQLRQQNGYVQVLK